MKYFFMLLSAVLSALGTASAQNEYNYQKRSLFEVLPARSNDGLHLMGPGCRVWKQAVEKQVK